MMTIKPEKFVIAAKRENRRYSIESKIHIAISLFYAIANHNFLDRNEGHFYAFQTNTYIKKRGYYATTQVPAEKNENRQKEGCSQ